MNIGKSDKGTSDLQGSPNIAKRRRSKDSPEEGKIKRIQGDLSVVVENKNMALTLESISNLLDAKLRLFSQGMPSKEDFRVLEEKMDRVIAENLALKKEIEELKKREIRTSYTVENLVNKSKAKNLVFRGMEESDNNDKVKIIKQMCEEVLQLSNVSINKAFNLRSNGKKDVILVEFNEESTALEVLKNANKLKGTGIFIHRDLCERTRRRRRCLLKIREKIKQMDDKALVGIRNSHFIFKGKSFSWDFEEGLKCNGRDGLGCLTELMTLSVDQINGIKKLLEELIAVGDDVLQRVGRNKVHKSKNEEGK